MPRKPWARCPICRSGKVWIESYTRKADEHVEYDCLCRSCCVEFTIAIKIREGYDDTADINGHN